MVHILRLINPITKTKSFFKKDGYEKYYLSVYPDNYATSANALPYYNDNHLLTATGYTSPYAGAIVETFDGTIVSGKTPVQNWTIVGTNYAIRQGSIQEAASPWYDTDPNPLVTVGSRDTTKYLTVPVNIAEEPKSIEIWFGGAQNYLGLWWGSMDDYNKLEFLDSAGVAIAGQT